MTDEVPSESAGLLSQIIDQRRFIRVVLERQRVPLTKQAGDSGSTGSTHIVASSLVVAAVSARMEGIKACRMLWMLRG